MQTTLTRRRDVPITALAVLFALLAVSLELLFELPLRLPGHRALPGALAMILFAQVTGPRPVIVFTAVVCLLLALLPTGQPLLALPWLALLPLVLLAQGSRFARAGWMLVALGLSFGLLRVAMLWGGFHKTPRLIRVGGHLSFGALGGLLALAISRTFPNEETPR